MRKRETEVEDRKKQSREALRKRSRAKKATEEALRTKTLTEKRKADTTEMLPQPPASKMRATTMPPAAGDGPTSMISAERATTMPPATVVNTPTTISRTEAENLARENNHITIVESNTYPGRYYTFNKKDGERRWIV